jgi:hypothetical protein
MTRAKLFEGFRDHVKIGKLELIVTEDPKGGYAASFRWTQQTFVWAETKPEHLYVPIEIGPMLLRRVAQYLREQGQDPAANPF